LGLRVENNVVVVDHAMNEHLLTTAEGNPSEDTVEELRVISVFQRRFNSAKLARKRDEKVIGDNCPLIYALKGKDGLSVEFKSIKILNLSIPEIIGRIAQLLGNQLDLVASMPSSSPLAAILGRRLSRAVGRPHTSDLFTKATNAQASAQVSLAIETDRKAFTREEEVALKNVLKHLSRVPEEAYTAKNVRPAIRKYFEPLAMGALPQHIQNQSRILLVDDLLATGETLKAAHRLLSTAGLQGEHAGVTWFSRVKK